jgi:hypothetical protein
MKVRGGFEVMPWRWDSDSLLTAGRIRSVLDVEPCFP